MKLRYLCLTALIVLMAVAPLSAQQAQGEKAKQEGAQKESGALTVKRLVIATGIENREPVGVAELFPASTEKVFCFLEATDIAKEGEIAFVWYHDQKELRKVTLPVGIGTRWRTYAYKNLYGLKGAWKVEVRDAAGTPLKETSFKVE